MRERRRFRPAEAGHYVMWRPALAGLIVAFALAIAGPAAAQTPPLLVDRDVTVGAGASIVVNAGAALAAAEARVVPVRLFDEHGVARRAANIAYRVARFTLFDRPQEHWLYVANHEVFGHGGRLRERFDGPISYSIDGPPPYGPGGGATFFDFNREPSIHEVLAVSAGGMEANHVGADLIADGAIAGRRIGMRTAERYLGMRLDAVNYIRSTGDAPEEPGQDVSDFLQAYNVLARAAGAPLLTARTLRHEALVSYADPMLAFSIAGIARFIATGNDSVPVFMIPIGRVRDLPSLRYRLTPFGTEWAVVNDVSAAAHAVRVEVRSGRSPGASPWGIGLRDPGVVHWRSWRVGLAVDVWHQPPIALEGGAPIDLALHWGGEMRARASKSVARVGAGTLDLVVDVGGKSNGFVAGEPLASGALVRIGAALPLGGSAR